MFKVKTYGKSEFAWLMFPKMRDPSAAQDKLCIRLALHLHNRKECLPWVKEMASTGERDNPL